MRVWAFLLAAAVLGGCVSTDEGGPDVSEVLNVTAYEDDAHCKSLALRPGELVYAQCRLAMERTYLVDYNERKAAIEAEMGMPISESFERALRADAFCNYDESMKAAPNAFDQAVAANLAYANCESTRAALEQEIAALGRDPMTFTLAEQPTVLKQNVDTIRETMRVINGPTG